MTTNTAEPSGDDPEGKHNHPLATAVRGNEPQVPGRLDTYLSRSKWYRQVRVEACPKCGHPHLHRAPSRSSAASARPHPAVSCTSSYSDRRRWLRERLAGRPRQDSWATA